MWELEVCPTCALVLQPLAVVSLLADAVVLSRVRAALTAGHHVAAIPARVTQRGAARQILLDVAAWREVWRGEKTNSGIRFHHLEIKQVA